MPTRQVHFHEQAAAEYDAAFEWYLQRSPSAARDFNAEVVRAVARSRSSEAVGSGPHGTHRYLLRKFPFLIVYRERSDHHIQIVAVAHTSRKPGYWEQRTEE